MCWYPLIATILALHGFTKVFFFLIRSDNALPRSRQINSKQEKWISSTDYVVGL